jgi:hypothetical protein
MNRMSTERIPKQILCYQPRKWNQLDFQEEIGGIYVTVTVHVAYDLTGGGGGGGGNNEVW